MGAARTTTALASRPGAPAGTATGEVVQRGSIKDDARRLRRVGETADRIIGEGWQVVGRWREGELVAKFHQHFIGLVGDDVAAQAQAQIFGQCGLADAVRS